MKNRKRIGDWVQAGRFWVNVKTGRVLPILQGGALPATDTFTTASDQVLTTYSASWTNNNGTFLVVAENDFVRSNTDSTETGAHWNADAFSNDQYAQIVYTGEASGGLIGPAVRCHASAATWYGFYADTLASYLYKIVSGSWTQLGSNGTSPAVNDVMRIEAFSTTITPKINGVTTGIGAQTDSSDNITSGYAGICGYGTGVSTYGDNWEGGNLGGGAVNLTAAQNNQAQVSDAANVKAYYPISPSQQNQAQVSDLVSLSLATTSLTAAQNNQAQVSDAATLGAITPISPSQQNQAQVSDAATLGAITPLSAAEDNQAQVSDTASLGAITLITVADNNQAQASDVALPGAITLLSAAENNQAQASDAATFGVIHPITAAEANQAQVSDAATLTAGEVSITADDNHQAQISDAAIITAYYPITAADNNQAQVSDAASITFSGVGTVNVTAAENNQAQVSDAASITAYYPITADDNNQAQVSDEVSISTSGPEWSITVAENNQGQTVDIPGLGVVYILNAAENNQAQVSDLAVLSIGGLIEHGTRRLYELKVREDSVFATRTDHELGTRVDLEVDDE